MLGTLTTNVRRLKGEEGSANVRIVSVETGCERARLSSSGAIDAGVLEILMVSVMAVHEISQSAVLRPLQRSLMRSRANGSGLPSQTYDNEFPNILV